jgi:hypothetical protein
LLTVRSVDEQILVHQNKLTGI